MEFDPQSLARPAILAMQAYQSARSQTKAGASAAARRVFLDANELSDAASVWSRYPDPQPASLQELMSAQLDVPTANLFLGAGVDDAIDALLRVFCEARQDSIVVTPPTYGYYGVAAAIQGAEVLAAPLSEESFDLDEAEILRQCQARTKLVFVCTPNNPTGNGFAPERLLALADTLRPKALLVVDEAYIEFSGRASLAAAAARAGNLVVLRTLSKAWGLAGARLGVAVGDERVIGLMHKVRAPYPISRPAIEAGVAELRRLDAATMERRLKAVTAARDELATELARLPGVLEVYPSEANFLLIRAASAAEVMRRCTAAGIIVRDRSSEPGLRDCVRITVGSPAENEALLAALTGRGGLA